MTALTLIATPDPEPFHIHAQPTWIALGIGRLRREYAVARVVSVRRSDQDHGDQDYAWVDFLITDGRCRAAIRKSDMGIVYVDEVSS